jgi:Ribbon-helix-helix protein, copG family
MRGMAPRSEPRLELAEVATLPSGAHLRYYPIVARSIKEIPKKRGRPATGKDPLVTLRLPAPMIAALAERAEAAGVSRSQTMRQLIAAGLKRRPKP